MKACVTCGSSCPPAGWERCRACVRAGRASQPNCPVCGEPGVVRHGACQFCRAQAKNPSIKIRRPQSAKAKGASSPAPEPAPARPARRAQRRPARKRAHARPYSRKDFVALDGTLIPRGGMQDKRNAARQRMRKIDAERAHSVRHLVRRPARRKGAPAPVPASMSSTSDSYDWWRYD
jgi:hypothetical protein